MKNGLQESKKILKEGMDLGKIFFILNHGREGSKWLKEIINLDPNALCLHEPEKQYDYCRNIHPEWNNWRINQIKIYAKKVDVYGETTPHLFDILDDLITAFPDATFIHLIRDGRKSARSFYNREPEESLEDHCKWWNTTHKKLYKYFCVGYKFELLVSNWFYFKSLMNKIGVNIKRSEWKKIIKKKVNSTQKWKVPDWDKTSLKMFWRVCGDTMRKNGYWK